MSDNNSTDIILGIQFDEQDASRNLQRVMSKIQNNSGELGFKIGVDDKALEGKISTLAKSAKAMLEKQTANLDINVNDTSLKTLKGKLDEIKKASYQLTDLKIDTKIDSNGLDVINKSILVYKDNLGKTIKETMVLKQEIDKLTNKPMPVFKTDKVNYVSNYDAIEKAYANDKKAVYQELINLQRQEFSLKEKMIGKEGELRDVLNEQLKLNRQKQGEVWKFSNDKGLKDAELGNNYLVERQGLLDKLKVSQAQYNQNLENEKKKIAENIKLYQDQMNTRLKGFTDKNKDIIPQSDLANLQKRLNELNATSLSGLQTEIKKVNNEFEQLKIATKANGKSLGGMDYLIESGKKIATWFGIGSIVGSASQAIYDMVGFTTKLDTALTDLTKVVSLTRREMDQATNSAIKLGKELGQSSVDIMDGMAEFGRVTKNLSEINELTRVATMASNVTDLSVNESAKALNTSMINFNVSAKDSMSILNGWNEVQNNFRTSAHDLADSISEVGSAGKQASVDINTLNGYTTALVSGAGISGSEAGTALKTAISRTFRLGKDGVEDNGKTGKILEELGIKVRNAEGQFRSFKDIIDDSAKKFKEFNEAGDNVRANYLTQALGVSVTPYIRKECRVVSIYPKLL